MYILLTFLFIYCSVNLNYLKSLEYTSRCRYLPVAVTLKTESSLYAVSWTEIFLSF